MTTALTEAPTPTQTPSRVSFSRKLVLRTATVGVVFFLAYCGSMFAFPETSQELGLDFWTRFDEDHQLDMSSHKREQLDAASETVRRRVTLKNQTIGDLIAGRITFAKASDQFLAMNKETPKPPAGVKTVLRASSDEQLSAIQVVEHVRARAKVDPTVPAEVVTRVEGEFAKVNGSATK